MAVTATTSTYQWAEMARIARGRSTAAPKTRHASVHRLWSRAFIGFPWPRKAAGMVVISVPLPVVRSQVPMPDALPPGPTATVRTT